MVKNKIIDLVYDEATGAYVPGSEAREEPEEQEEPKKERVQRKEKKSFQEPPFQALSHVPNNPVGNVLHGIQTGIFVMDEIQKMMKRFKL